MSADRHTRHGEDPKSLFPRSSLYVLGEDGPDGKRPVRGSNGAGDPNDLFSGAADLAASASDQFIGSIQRIRPGISTMGGFILFLLFADSELIAYGLTL